MKRILSIAKIAALLIILIASFFGYRFFHVWQDNSRPTVSQVSWQTERVQLGKPAILIASIKVPWHREITSAIPTQTPAFLVATKTGGELRKGTLTLNGHRTWSIRIPLVPSTLEPVAALPIELPLNSSRRISPGTLAIPLPPLETFLPEEIPDAPITSTDPLKPDAPAPEAVEPTSTKNTFPTAIFVSCLLGALMIGHLIYRLATKPKPTIPAWETANAALQELEKNPPPDSAPYFLRLTDILKQYATQRFDIPADAASTPEFLESMKAVPEIQSSLRSTLASVVRQADSAKFAAASVATDARSLALTHVREFVLNTTPKTEEEHA